MTNVYEVHTKHTKKVLNDFITFSTKVNNPTGTFRMSVFALCFFTLAFFLGKERMTAAIILGAIGALLLVFILFRRKISFVKLSKEDKDYQSQSEIKLMFGYPEFIVVDANHPEGVHIKYNEISSLYDDKENYFIGVNNETLHVIPMTAFVEGKAEDFRGFIEEQAKKTMLPTVIPWKMRIQMMKELRDKKEEIRLAEQKEKKKK